MGAAKQKLDEVVKDTQDELKHSVKAALHAEAQSVEAERAAMAVKENLLDAEIARLSRGDTRFDAQWASDVNTIGEDLRRVREGAHRNNTRIQAALHASEADLQKEQGEAYGDRERAQDREEFNQVENRDRQRFQANITADVREEQEAVELRMREQERGFDERAHTAFAGPKDREVDLKNNLQALARKVQENEWLCLQRRRCRDSSSLSCVVALCYCSVLLFSVCSVAPTLITWLCCCSQYSL